MSEDETRGSIIIYNYRNWRDEHRQVGLLRRISCDMALISLVSISFLSPEKEPLLILDSLLSVESTLNKIFNDTASLD
jgi:hypothetical protein